MPSSGVPCPDCYATRSPGVADGIYVENGHDIYFENVTFEYELPRKVRSSGVIYLEIVHCYLTYADVCNYDDVAFIKRLGLGTAFLQTT